MKPCKYKNVKLYHKLKPWDVNKDIRDREDKYQDAVLANLERKKMKESKR